MFSYLDLDANSLEGAGKHTFCADHQSQRQMGRRAGRLFESVSDDRLDQGALHKFDHRAVSVV